MQAKNKLFLHQIYEHSKFRLQNITLLKLVTVIVVPATTVYSISKAAVQRCETTNEKNIQNSNFGI